MLPIVYSLHLSFRRCWKRARHRSCISYTLPRLVCFRLAENPIAASIVTHSVERSGYIWRRSKSGGSPRFGKGKFISVFLILWGIVAINSVHASQTMYRDFWHPRYHGKRLAYCNLEQSLCGDALATKYCKRMGYAKMEVANIAYNVGFTNFIDSKAYCHGYPCDGFQLIRCSRSLSHHSIPGYYYRWRHFPVPRLNGYRVDWCYDGTKGCGKRAAYSFCRRLGYKTVKQYRREGNIGATRALANQKNCFGKQCQGFAHIDCFR